jgi:soluble lytic murein transglycosylase-like protein
LLVLLFFAAPAWAQTTHYAVPAASVEDQFSAYHQALSGAANDLLATIQSSSSAPRITSLPLAANAPLVNDGALRRFAQRYWDGQEQNVRRAVARVALLRAALDPILHQEGIPTDAVALVLVESGGRNTALSPKGALGLWQLMPETARRYGLAVGPGQDDRVDVAKSTRAAACYLRDLYSQFGDWSLAFAAYNAGEPAVQRAIAQNGAHDFESISRSQLLPLETRHYVPAVLSAVQVLGGILPVTARSFRRPGNPRVMYADGGP